jgi:para-nitrobenzyl esterase
MCKGIQSSARSSADKITSTNIMAVGAFAIAALLEPGHALATSNQGQKPIVQTSQGPVQGFQTKGIAEFLGIPYAAPPVGNLRWRPPAKPAPWKSVRQATSFHEGCAQSNAALGGEGLLGVFAGPADTNEDCLYLNVFTPNTDSNNRFSEKLPVVFWIHGGGNFDGEASDYDGSKLASQGHTVVVSIDYRLGSLGWLAVPALDSEGHLFGNYGLLDSQAALGWVQQNIAKFGGDPNNVTVGGQSAGSFDTEGNLISPLARGLFHRAILQSLVTEPETLATAEAAGTTFASDAHCTGTNSQIAACLRALTVTQIQALPANFSFIGDGTILPRQPATTSPTQPGAFYAAFQSGDYNHMPIISGTVEDEYVFFQAIAEYDSSPRTPPTAANYSSTISSFGSAGVKVAELYPLVSSSPPGPELAVDRLETDSFECAQHRINRVIASGPSPSPVYAYEFDDRSAPFYFPPLPGLLSLAYHTADIQYLFPLWHGGPLGIPHALNPQQENLSNELVAAWTNLAWTGNPNGRANSPWPRYQGGSSNSYYLLENILPTGLSRQTDAQYVAKHNCNFWDTINTP